ncbi:MAG: DUF5916 domain-containing protein [Gallionella sp.]
MQSTETPLRLDGKLDDAAWQQAAVITDLVQAYPVESAAPSQKTTVYLLHDADNLFIGVRADDSEPGSIVAHESQRDAELDNDDSIGIALDTFHDRQRGYYFQVNSLGTQSDALIAAGGQSVQREWDAIWHVATTRDAGGWSAEIAIPFKSLNFDAHGDTWGFNIERVLARNSELIRWANPSSSKAVYVMGNAGELLGMSGMSQGLGLDVIPNVRMKTTRTPAGSNMKLQPGLDVLYKVTPQATLALTFNTDFADAEVDQRQVNLSRYPLALPEKRAFFLQDSNYFQFAQGYAQPFYSRRIGTDAAGQAVDLDGGIKLSGRSERINFGLLEVQTRATGNTPTKNLAVGRASLDVGEESAIGALFTQGNPAASTNNSVAGLDYRYRDSNLLGGGEVLEASAYRLRSEDAGVEGSAWGAHLSYPNFFWEGSLGMDEAGEAYKPALGFVSMPGTRNYAAALSHVWQPPGLEFFTADASFSRRSDLNGQLISQSVTPLSLGVIAKSRDNFTLSFSQSRDSYGAPVTFLPGIMVPAGEYTGNRWSLGLGSSSNRALSGSLNIANGGYLTGNSTDYSLSLTWYAQEKLNLTAAHSISAIRLPLGKLDVRTTNMELKYAFSPRLALNWVGQYDNVSEALGMNARLRWTIQPGSDLFVVYSHNVDTSQGGFRNTGSELTTKLVWDFRL